MAHETAHQWFYGIVGNDGERDAFADEALAGFLARDALGTLCGSRCRRDRLDRSIHAYSRGCYYETIHIQGGLFLDGLRRDFGAAGSWAALPGALPEPLPVSRGQPSRTLPGLRMPSGSSARFTARMAST